MTPLSQFMTDMRDSDNMVGVKEYMLRDFVNQSKEWELLAKKQSDTIAKLQTKIEKLEDDIDLYKIENRRLKKQSIETIDLYS